jgi:hypothetical protein
MIVEEIIGDVTATIIKDGQTIPLSVGSEFNDHERAGVTVTGTGKIVVRVDQNCTIEIRGVEPAITETPTPVVTKLAKVAKADPVAEPVSETPVTE